MSIQEFAGHLEQKLDPSPLLQALQALRKCDPSHVRAEFSVNGWAEWPGATS